MYRCMKVENKRNSTVFCLVFGENPENDKNSTSN